MTLFFFNREIENPVLRVIIALGALVFAISVVVLVMAIALPLAGIALTGALVIAGIVLVVVLVTVPFLSFLGILFSNRKKGSGVEKSRVVDVKSFEKVKVSGAIKIDIVCGQPQSVVITTDDNLLESVETVVKDGELSVAFARSVSSSLGAKIQIAMVDLKKIRMYGATRTSITNLNTDELLIRGSGACKMTASGECRDLVVKLSGAGNLAADELISGKVKINISGAVKAVVHAIEEVSVKISGSGRVICHGNPPVVHKHISGSGRIEITE